LEGVERAMDQPKSTLSNDEAQRFVRHFDEGIGPVLETPRMAKRYAHALEFALRLLAGEANVVDVMLVEGLRVFFPPLYEAGCANGAKVIFSFRLAVKSCQSHCPTKAWS
jgi:hypothetical protein